jgi:very-short-patch-repair endonuclease
LPEPEVNAPIRNRYGAIVAHADLAYPAQRVVIEYDGGHHRADERQYNIDIDRLDELMEEGWRVIRVNKNLLARRATLVGKVRTALAEADQRRQPSSR